MALRLFSRRPATIRGRMDEVSGDSPSPQDAALASVPRTVVDVLRTGHAAGIDRYGDLGLPFESYAADVVELVRSARAAMGLETNELQLAAAVAKRALADLYLTRACEHAPKAAPGGDSPWDVLVARFHDRLVAAAVREGMRGAEPERRASALLGDLALEPVKSNHRTRIGAFAGMGALWPWLASQLVRAVWRQREKAARADAHEDQLERTSADARASRSKPKPVWAEAVGSEAGDALEAAIGDAWSALPDRARTCFILKHRHRVPQRRIAALLGVGEPAVSRQVKKVVDAIREAAGKQAALCADATTRGGEVWEELKARLASTVTRLAAAGPPMDGVVAEELERMRRE